LLGVIVLLVGLWFLIFDWDWNRWPRWAHNEVKCYSPNGDYYVLRYQSLFESFFSIKQDSVYGTVKIYDKTGKFLFSGKARLGTEYGPHWFGDSIGYMGFSSEWVYETPSSTGVTETTGYGSCFNLTGEFQAEIQ